MTFIERKYQSIALNLLKKYIEAEESVCGEFSNDFYKDRLRLEKEIKDILKVLNAQEKYDYIIKDCWIFDIECYDEEENK
mgnify:CR=1 FL=1